MSKKEGKRKQTVEADTDDHDETALRQILDGNQKVISHETSQYQGRGVSACGLAALNCARIVLGAERKGISDEDIFRFIVSRNTAEEITSICNKWSSTTHLEVDDILCVPIFSTSLQLVSSQFAKPSFESFKSLLLKLESQSPKHRSAALIITRPPEIITCIKIAMSAHNIFLIFDSHPRPSHPRGAGFTFNLSIDRTARTLIELFAVDSRLLADKGMQWEMQLLANFSGHMLLSIPEAADSFAELSATVLESSLQILALRAEVEELKSRNLSLIKDKKLLENKPDDTFAKTSVKRDKRKSRSKYAAPSESSVHQSSYAIASSSKTDSGYWSHDAQSPRAPIIYYSGEPFSPSTADDQDPSTLDSTSDDVQRQSANVALQTQIEFEEEDRRLRAEHAQLVAHSIQTIFKCSVCLDEHPEDYVARVNTCRHTFCRDCLRTFIISKLDEHCYPIFCPICTAEKTSDPGAITDSLVQQLGVPDNYYQILAELQISAFSILLHCRRCTRSAFVDRAEYQESKTIACPMPGCNYVWCKSCSREISFGGVEHSCDGSSELEHLMKSSGWKHCPGCTTPILKESGCNHMTCMSPGCNTHFCYVCGKLIVRSALGREIKAALSAHYSKCLLF